MSKIRVLQSNVNVAIFEKLQIGHFWSNSEVSHISHQIKESVPYFITPDFFNELNET